MVNGFFITGTDTEVGKTYVSSQLIKGFSQRNIKVSGYKPVASGAMLVNGQLANEDALQLMQHASVKLPYKDVNPFCFEPAIAPHLAAQRAGVDLDVSVIKEVYKRHDKASDLVIVEGAGGWKVPLTDELGFDDMAQQLGLPVVLVVGLRLGCINHALLTEESILASGCRLVGWVANSVTPNFNETNENIFTLKRKMKTPCLGYFGHALHTGETPDITKSNIETTLDYLMDFS